MPRGDKRKYTDKQKRKAEHIEEGYKARGVSAKTAAARAWATVNAEHGGGEKPGGSGYGKPENKEPARRGGKRSQMNRTAASRSRAGQLPDKKKAAATRKRNKARRSRTAKRAARRR